MYFTLASNIIQLSQNVSEEKANKMVTDALNSGKAYKKFLEMVKAQGGDINLIENTDNFEKAKFTCPVKASSSGYISEMDAEKIGISAMLLGAGRATKTDVIDYDAGILLVKKTGDHVEKGAVIARLFTTDSARFENAEKAFLGALTFGECPAEPRPLIFGKIGGEE